jgi:beta-glucosidase
MDENLSTAERVNNLMSLMSNEDKAGQMVQGLIGVVSYSEMTELGLGSVLSGGGAVPGDGSVQAWQLLIDNYQDGAMTTSLGIPFIYGIDAVHGHSNVYGAVIFPQNIGLGAANDPELMYKMGAAVAEEMKLTHTLWNFSPCVAVAQDPRWGRTYESFSSDPEIVSELALAYYKGLSDHGIVATAKHFAGDGGTIFGTGEGENLIDRGDTVLSDRMFRDIHIKPYEALVEEGLKIVMVSFSSINGVKMSESKYYITDVLKGELGFDGIVVSDWEATLALSGENFEQNVILAVNSGIDILMEPNNYKFAISAILSGLESGKISQERVDDAVSRILTVKFDLGLFEDPYLDNLTHEVDQLGSEEYRKLAKTLVSESLVLLKNEGNILPLQAGSKIYVTGPAADDIGVQCGGWTITWQGSPDGYNKNTEGTTILEGLEEYASQYGLEIITDPDRAAEADVVILAIGEIPYAEMLGDTEDMSIVGALGLEGNSKAIEAAELLGKPIVTLIVAGRNVLIDEYLPEWDSVVMCYLPGTEGDGIASVLVGQETFSGKLAMPWYADTKDIGTAAPVFLFDQGYGLNY